MVGVAVLVVHGDEAGGVPETVGLGDGVDAGEWRHDHRKREWQHFAAGELDLAGANLVDRRVRDPSDAEPIEEFRRALL
jgi:hypothetical protein